MDFGVRRTRLHMLALPDDLAAVRDDAADARVGAGGKASLPCEGEGELHVLGVLVSERRHGGCNGMGVGRRCGAVKRLDWDDSANGKPPCPADNIEAA